MPTQTGSIDLKATSGFKTYADGSFATQGQVTSLGTAIEANAEAISLRATKTEAYQLAQPNMSPFFESTPYRTATTYDGGYWQNTTDNWLMGGVTYLSDGWAHVTRAASTRLELAIPRIESIDSAKKYTLLFEWRDITVTGSPNLYARNYPQSCQFTSNSYNCSWTTSSPTSGTKRVSMTVDTTTKLTSAWQAAINLGLTNGSNTSFDGDIRLSLYEETQDPDGNWVQYAGPYKPYSGKTLYATQSELNVTSDGITSEVSKISSAKYLTSSTASWTLANIKVWAADGYTSNWNVTSTANVRVGDTAYVKGYDSTRQCSVYIKGTVTAVNSSTSLTMTAHGYEDVLPVETIKSTINQSADSVKIEARHVDIAGAAVFSNYSTTSQMNSAISSAVSSAGVGGRNYILNSSGVLADGLGSAAGSRHEYQAINLGQSYMSLPEGTQVTVSFDLYMTVNTANPSFQVYNTNNDGPKCFAGTEGHGEASGVMTYFTAAAGTVIDKRVSVTGYIRDRDNAPSLSNWLEFYTGYGTSNWFRISNLKMEKGYVASDWEPAPEDELKLEQRIYYRTANATAPGTPSEWVVSEATANNTWSTKRMQYDSTYKYLYTCIQRQTVGGTVTHTTVLLDDTTTVIDGGSIIANSIAANTIKADSGTFNEANIPNLSASKITSGSISIGILPDSVKNSNVKIGGANLLVGSDVEITGIGSQNITTGFSLSRVIPKGTTVVVSVQIDADNITWAGSGSRRFGFEMNQVSDGVSSGIQYVGVWWGLNGTSAGGEDNGTNYAVDSSVTSFHGRICNKVTLTRDFPVNMTGCGIYIQNLASGSTVYVSKPQVEIATKMSDWSLAPSDTMGERNLVGRFNRTFSANATYSESTGTFTSTTTTNTTDGLAYCDLWTGTTSSSAGTFVRAADIGGYNANYVGKWVRHTFTKDSTFTHVRLKFNGNKTDAAIMWDISSVPNGTRLSLSYHIDSISSDGAGNGGVLSGINLRTGSSISGWTPAPEDQVLYVDSSVANIPGMAQIATSTRSFTTAQWKNYAAATSGVSWTTGSSYDNSKLRVGDTAYITGTVSDGVGGSATLIGTVNAVSTSAVGMYPKQLIFGGDSVDNAAKTATNFITQIDSAGIFVSPANQTPTTSSPGNSAKITADGLTVYRSGTDVASFGASARIGANSAAHVMVTPTYLAETSPAGDNLFEVGRILDDDGYAEYVDTRPLSASTSVFALPHYGATIKGYTYNGQTGAVTIDPLTVSVNGTVTSAYTLSMVSEAGGDVIHVTLGTAAASGSVVQISYRTTASSVLSMQFGLGAQATGECSAAFGVNSIASGDGSHAEGGYYTVSGDIATYYAGGTAKSDASHAEGNATLAGGIAAHAEGMGSKALGHGSHAEGGYHVQSGNSVAHLAGGVASGNGSHAEGGGTTASGHVAHAEGWNTVASGNQSHAQGHETVAAYEDQTVIGRYNSNNSSNVFEIGKGTSSARSNALAVDWSGNVTAAGEISGTVSASTVSLASSVSASTAAVRRMGNLVTVYFVNLKLASNLANNGEATVGTVPAGYRPTYTAYAHLGGYQNGGSYITINSGGSVEVHNYSGSSIPTSRNLGATLTYVM